MENNLIDWYNDDRTYIICSICNQRKPKFYSYLFCSDCRNERKRVKFKNNPWRNLDEDKIKQIKRLYSFGMPYRKIAKHLGIGRTQVWNIIINKNYKWVK